MTNVSFVGSTAFATELKQLGPRYSQGIIVTQVVPPIDSQWTAVIKYRELLKKYFPDSQPDFVSLEGYIATSILMESFRNAGPNPTTESTITALESMRGVALGIPATINYGPIEHQGSHKVWGTVLNEAARYHALNLD